MKTQIITGIMTATILMAGCGKKDGSRLGSVTPPTAQTDTASSAPISQPALTAWQQGDKATALISFVEADWGARPLFAAGSALSLSEDQFKALPDDERQTKSREMTAQLDSLKQLGVAVAQAGHDAASKGDTTQARKYFLSLKQCGTALDAPDRLQLVRLVGQAFKKLSGKEMAKIGQ